MQLRTLGRSSLRVAPLCLGGNVFGWTATEAASFAVLDALGRCGTQLHRHRRCLFPVGVRTKREDEKLSTEAGQLQTTVETHDDGRG